MTHFDDLSPAGKAEMDDSWLKLCQSVLDLAAKEGSLASNPDAFVELEDLTARIAGREVDRLLESNEGHA